MFCWCASRFVASQVSLLRSFECCIYRLFDGCPNRVSIELAPCGWWLVPVMEEVLCCIHVRVRPPLTVPFAHGVFVGGLGVAWRSMREDCWLSASCAVFDVTFVLYSYSYQLAGCCRVFWKWNIFRMGGWRTSLSLNLAGFDQVWG